MVYVASCRLLLVLAVVILRMNFTSSWRSHNLSWDIISGIVRSIVPPLTKHAYKGQSGRLGVIGGTVLQLLKHERSLIVNFLNNYSIGSPEYTGDTTLRK